VVNMCNNAKVTNMLHKNKCAKIDKKKNNLRCYYSLIIGLKK